MTNFIIIFFLHSRHSLTISKQCLHILFDIHNQYLNVDYQNVQNFSPPGIEYLHFEDKVHIWFVKENLQFDIFSQILSGIIIFLKLQKSHYKADQCLLAYLTKAIMASSLYFVSSTLRKNSKN